MVGFRNPATSFISAKKRYHHTYMVDSSYYEKLKGLVDSGHLATHIVIAPPRTNSSLVEHVMGNSPDIDHECHEPFLGARRDDFDPDHGYKQIYDSIGGEQFERSGEKTSVTIKEMSHWIGKNDEYQRLSELTRNPILILIRNPLLSVESRIRRVVSTLDMRSNIDIQRAMLDYVATEKGFPNWNDFLGAIKNGSYTEPLDFLHNGEDLDRLHEVSALSVQNELMNFMARRNGYINWRDLAERKLYTERDYAFFENILKANPRRTDFEKDEFRKLEEEAKYLESAGKEHFVFDTTDIRAAPEEQLREMCSRIGIAFSPEMLEWGQTPVDFHTEQTQEFERVWYDTLFSSSRVNPPVEVPPTLEMFPRFIRQYLRADNLGVYAELSRKKILSDELRHELNEREFSVAVTPGNREQLRELGVIGENISIGTEASVKLKYIDPIYAITNEPELAQNSEFKELKREYADELKIVSDIVGQYDEHTREWKTHTRETRFR